MSTLQAAVNGEIKHVDDWLISNKLTLNCSKTKFMVLTRSHELQKIKINDSAPLKKWTKLNTMESLLVTNYSGNSN